MTRDGTFSIQLPKNKKVTLPLRPLIEKRYHEKTAESLQNKPIELHKKENGIDAFVSIYNLSGIADDNGIQLSRLSMIVMFTPDKK